MYFPKIEAGEREGLGLNTKNIPDQHKTVL